MARFWRPVTSVSIIVVTIIALILINGHATHDTAATSTPRAATAAAWLPAPGHRYLGGSTPVTGVPVANHRNRSPKPAALATVTVLNNSTRTGLAHDVAGLLEARGWPVGYVGNLRGRIAEVTAYFAPGSKAAARHLAEQFSSIRRVMPNRMLPGLHTQGVTLVLTRDWAG